MPSPRHPRLALYSLAALLAFDLLAAIALVMDQWLELGTAHSWLLAAIPVLVLLPALSAIARAVVVAAMRTTSRERENKSRERDNPSDLLATHPQGPHHATS